METTTIISEALRPITDSLTGDVAKQFAELKLTGPVQDRVDVLASKCNEGELTEQEKSEYESLVKVGNILAVLKAKARKIVAEQS